MKTYIATIANDTTKRTITVKAINEAYAIDSATRQAQKLGMLVIGVRQKDEAANIENMQGYVNYEEAARVARRRTRILGDLFFVLRRTSDKQFIVSTRMHEGAEVLRQHDADVCE